MEKLLRYYIENYGTSIYEGNKKILQNTINNDTSIFYEKKTRLYAKTFIIIKFLNKFSALEIRFTMEKLWYHKKL